MRRIFFGLFLFTLTSITASAQSPDGILNNFEEKNFFEVQQQMNEYYSTHPNASGFKQWKRLEHYLTPRVYPNGDIINFEAKNTLEYIRMGHSMDPTGDRSTNASWSFHGPTTITDGSMGRINCVDFDPNNPNIIYIGSSSGGVWKSSNNGSTWQSISPFIPSLAIADVEIDPNNSNIIYLLTGDGFNNARPSIGMLKSTDSGETWHTTGLTFSLTEFYLPEKLLIHPSNADIQLIATNKGLLITSDGWETEFNPLTDVRFAGKKIFDLEFKPGDPNTVYLSMEDAQPIRKSVNGGSSWSPITNTLLNSILGNTNKLEIAVSANNPACLYAFGGNSGPVGLLRSLDNGVNWTVRDTTIANLGVQSSYNMSLAVNPSDYNHIYLGLVWTKRSNNGGLPGSWVGPSNYVHADVHESKFKNGDIYHCNDGGLFKSSDNGVNFTELSQGISNTEVYQICGTPLTPGLLYAGTQDNGTIQRSAGGSYKEVTGNDGAFCLINYTNSNIAYTSHQNGVFHKTTNGGSTFVQLVVPQEGTGAFLSPMIMDPVEPKVMFIGLENVWRNENEMEEGLYYDLGKPPGSGVITEMAQSHSHRSTIYASSGEKLYRTTNAYTNSGEADWVQINNELPDRWITGIAIDPNHNGKIYITFGGYGENDKVYFSDSWGNPGSWQNLTENLPNVPVNCIAYHQTAADNDALYIGTDIGVFYTNADLGSWIYFSNYLPSVRVNDLYINTTSNQLIAGTYGRGIWSSDLFTDCTPSLNLNGIDGGSLTYSASNSIQSSVDYIKDFSTQVKYRSGNYIDLKIGFECGSGAVLNAEIGPCPIIYAPMVGNLPERRTNNFYTTPAPNRNGK